jgi:hypothetical protein
MSRQTSSRRRVAGFLHILLAEEGEDEDRPLLTLAWLVVRHDRLRPPDH